MVTPETPTKSLHINTERTYRGGEQQVLYLLEGLQRQGYAAHLICQPNSGLYQRALQQGIPSFPLRMRGEADPVAAYHIARKIKQESYDIVHAHTPHAVSLVMGGCSVLRNSPARIVTRRVQFSIFRHSFFGMNRFKYTKGVDHIIAISQKVKEMLMGDGIPQQMVSVVYSGVDVNRYRNLNGNTVRQEFSLPPGSPILGNVGYLEENKGQAFLIQSMSGVVQQYPEARLFIIGEGRLASRLKSLARQLHLEKNVIFTGLRGDVGAFLNILDVMVVSSLEEGLNSSILDALALEVPVVATDAGGISEIISPGKTGILVPPANANALSSGILQILKNPEEARTMAKKGAQRVKEDFSAETMVEKNIGIYRTLLAQRKSKTLVRW